MDELKRLSSSSTLLDEEEDLPVSPTGQYFTSSVISVSVICVLEFDFPIDDSRTLTLLKDVFLAINPRFSSIMVQDENGKKNWKKVDVKVKDHLNVPTFPEGKSPEFYEKCFTEYISKISLQEFAKSRPLWEIHILKYQTTNAAGNVVFKLHHSLGDGFSLMGALFSCLQRADNPKLPLTFPTLNQNKLTTDSNSFGRKLSNFLSGTVNTVLDFGWSLMKSSFLEDDKTPIRSGEEGVEFQPITVSTLIFSLDEIKQIKSNLGVTINDVICGVMFLGNRLYMQSLKNESSNADTTALVLLNTRNISGYKSVSDMIEPDSDSSWGNKFAFLHIPVPKLTAMQDESLNPHDFIHKAQDVIKRKRNSVALVLTGKLLEILHKYRGPKVTAKYIHNTLKNTSMTISNLIGPVEKMSLADQTIKGFYFMVVGVPQNLSVTMMSYNGNLRVAVGTENGLIDAQKFKSCVQHAFDIILEAAVTSSSVGKD